MRRITRRLERPKDKFLRAHPTHRHSKNVRLMDTKVTEESRRIIRHDRDRVQRIWLVAQPGAAVIEVDHLKVT